MNQRNVGFYDKRIAELEREYADLIQKPYRAGRLSEIISELGRMWNERLQYEDVESVINENGAKNLQQVQNEVSAIVSEAKQKIEKAKNLENKHIAYLEDLLKLRDVLNEWETEK
jgi:hypothetical protein